LGLTRLGVWLPLSGGEVLQGRPFHPQTQGKSERFHRTLRARFLSKTQRRDLSQAQAEFDAWRGMYNLQRPHEALGMRVPVSSDRPSVRAYAQTPRPPAYGPDDIVQMVMREGMISFRNRLWYISEALAGQRVGLRATTQDGLYRVCLGPHEVGRINQRHGSTHATRRRPPPAPLAANAGGGPAPNV
jgi:hypothetical protein